MELSLSIKGEVIQVYTWIPWPLGVNRSKSNIFDLDHFTSWNITKKWRENRHEFLQKDLDHFTIALIAQYRVWI